MSAIATVIASSVAATAITKPLADAYGSASGAIKGSIGKWMVGGVPDLIAQKIEEVELVRTIFKSDLVPLSSFYYPSKVRDASSLKQAWPASTVDQLHANGNVLLYGTVGQGKSMFMRNLCVSELRAGQRIPIFVELRNIDDKNSIIDLIRSAMELVGFFDISAESLDFLLSNAGFSIFLDGFDEVKRQYALPSYQSVAKLMGKYPNTRWIISSRPGGAATSLQAIPNITRLRLEELGEADFDPFLARLKVDSARRAKLLDAIKASSTDVKGVLTTPLMLTLLKETFGISANIPENLHDFYEALFHVLALRHDDIKDMYQRERATSLSNSELQESFEAFSFLSKEHGVSLNDTQFASCAKDAAKLSGKEFTPEGLKSDLTGVVCLMVPDGLRTAFIHKSIQEFFAAFFIKDFTNSELVSQFYRGLRQHKLMAWSQELNFLEKLDYHRYIEHFTLPNIDEFLSAAGYSEHAKVKISKANIIGFLQKLSTVAIESVGDNAGRTIYATCYESDVFNEATQKFLNYCFPRGRLLITNSGFIESISKMTEFKIIRIESYFKNNRAFEDSVIKKTREFSDRLNRDRSRHQKTLSGRKSDVTRLFLGQK